MRQAVNPLPHPSRQTTANPAADTVTHKAYRGLPETGLIRMDQLARNPRAPEIPALLPVSRTTVWRWVRADKFPAPIRLSGGITAWRVEDIRTWLQNHSV